MSGQGLLLYQDQDPDQDQDSDLDPDQDPDPDLDQDLDQDPDPDPDLDQDQDLEYLFFFPLISLPLGKSFDHADADIDIAHLLEVFPRFVRERASFVHNAAVFQQYAVIIHAYQRSRVEVIQAEQDDLLAQQGNQAFVFDFDNIRKLLHFTVLTSAGLPVVPSRLEMAQPATLVEWQGWLLFSFCGDGKSIDIEDDCSDYLKCLVVR